MFKYCNICGLRIIENSNSIKSYGTNFEENHFQTKKDAPIILPPEKSNKKIKTLAVIIILIIIMFSMFFVLFNYKDVLFYNGNDLFKDGDKSKIIGTWEGFFETSAGSFIITFSSDGNYNSYGDTDYISGFIYSSSSSGKWDLNNGKIIIHPNNGELAGIFTYQFFDNNQKLNLTQTNTGLIINLIKK